MITDIEIQNIKGYGSPAIKLDCEIMPGKVNLLIAPNGTGKSSLAAAFGSLKTTKLSVVLDYKYHKDETLPSSLSLCLDGKRLAADERQNTISAKLKCIVITNRTKVGTIQNNRGAYTAVSGYEDIANIVLVDTIPPIVNTAYRVSDYRKLFGTNSKVLSNLAKLFVNPDFILLLKNEIDKLAFFNNALSRKKLVSEIVDKVNSISNRKSAREICESFDLTALGLLESEAHYQMIINDFNDYIKDYTPLGKFLFFYQILNYTLGHKDFIRKRAKRIDYERRKAAVEKNLTFIDTTWRKIHLEEDSKGQLVVVFPHADEISNGQRDLLTFLMDLVKFRAQVSSSKKNLLIIDEVFDYLDDANIIVAQYYLSRLVQEYKDIIYVCLLTHLSPYTFRNYIFNNKILHIDYLFKMEPKATEPMKAFIAFREGLDKKDETQKKLYDNLSKNLFHYNPVVVDYKSNIEAIDHRHKIRSTWGKTQVLHQFLIEELNRYLQNKESYDPYAVALALRLRVEKMIYDKLPTQEAKDDFVNTHMTQPKFDIAEKYEISVPDVYRIVTAIHNDADHLKYDVLKNEYVEKSMVYKLQNLSIKNILIKIFGYEGTALSTAVIE